MKSLILKQDEIISLIDGTLHEIIRPIKQQPSEMLLTYDGEIEKLIEKCKYQPGDVVFVKEGFWCKNDTCDHEYCSGCDMGSLLELGSGYAEIDYIATPRCFDRPKCNGEEIVDQWKEGPEPGFWELFPPDDWDGKEDWKGKGTWGFLPFGFYTKYSPVCMPE